MTIDTKRLATDPGYWDEVSPSDATHYIIDHDSEGAMPPGFHKDEGDKYRECGSSAYWMKGSPSPLEVIPRPQKPEVEWDGEGLPPAGCECEYTARQHSSAHPSISPNQWYKCKIVAYHDGAVWTSDNGIRRLSNTIFRPIRTKEQRQRDELEDLIHSNLGPECNIEAAAIAIIDAGWKKDA